MITGFAAFITGIALAFICATTGAMYVLYSPPSCFMAGTTALRSACTAGITTFDSALLMPVAIGSNTSAPAILIFCHARLIFSDAVSVFSYTSSRAPPDPDIVLYISSNDNWPFCAASNMATPALAPKRSIASADVTDPSATPLTNSSKPSLALFPSLAQLDTPFFIPEST